MRLNAWFVNLWYNYKYYYNIISDIFFFFFNTEFTTVVRVPVTVLHNTLYIFIFFNCNIIITFKYEIVIRIFTKPYY